MRRGDYCDIEFLANFEQNYQWSRRPDLGPTDMLGLAHNPHSYPRFHRGVVPREASAPEG